MRLDKYLSNAGIGTRKQVKQIIKDGHVVVDSKIVLDYSSEVNFHSKIYVNDKLVNFKEYYYVLLNKPKGYISATYDNYHKVVLDLIPEFKIYNLAPVGRLDIDTTGVLLLTNNGTLSHALLSPKKHVNKEYLAEVNHPLVPTLIDEFKNGITLDDGYKCLPAELKIIDNFHAKITINEGKFHQIKRMFKTFDYEVIELQRTKFDELTCDGLKIGEYRELTESEISNLLIKLK